MPSVFNKQVIFIYLSEGLGVEVMVARGVTWRTKVESVFSFLGELGTEFIWLHSQALYLLRDRHHITRPGEYFNGKERNGLVPWKWI